ncbi:MAG TPA: hypothetical protein VFJ01_02440 [Oleiagrimonas sp.]|nr:hypothetical protein [Oleiagrimonas sp.]HET7299486.1 hypothetical protein [Oleiagrimonas sp.]
MRFVMASSRHPPSLLTRIAGTLVALVCLGAVVVFGLLALAILLVGGAVWLVWFRWRLHRLRKQAEAPDLDEDHSGVIEGEYVVIHESHDNAR